MIIRGPFLFGGEKRVCVRSVSSPDFLCFFIVFREELLSGVV
jgi:hypothetical protein